MIEKKGLYNAVVVFLVDCNKIMMMLKTAKIGKGCFNGPGGGLDEGETSAEAGIRELREESGVVTFLEHIEKAAIVDFHNKMEDESIFICRVHYFLCFRWYGIPESRPKENMINPTWFTPCALPYKLMMPADEDFISLLFEGKKDLNIWLLKAKAFLGSNQTKKLKPTEISWILRSD